MADTSPRAIGVEDLALLRWATEPALDADGKRLAFVAARLDASTDRFETRVHVCAVDGGATVVVPSDVPMRRPRWSPDGQLLAARALVDDRWRVAVFDASGARRCTAVLEGDIDAAEWTADGSRLVCGLSSDDAPSRQVWAVDLDSGVARRLLPPGAPEAWGPTCAPVGDRVAFVAPAGGDSTGVWTIDPSSAEPAALLAAGWARVEALSWSPDAATIALIAHPDAAVPWANRQLWIVDAATGGRRRLGADLDRSIGQVVRGDDERGLGPPSLAWSPDGRSVLAAVADGGTSSIIAFAADGSGAVALTAGRPAVLEFDVARGDGATAFTWSDPLTPGEVTVLRSDGEATRCSDLGAELRRTVELASTDAVCCRSDDGHPVEGWLTLPGAPFERPYPLVVQVHGGPHYPVGERFSFDAQRLAARGCAVLRANPRGSQGYGERFAAAVAGDWGGGDLDDLLDLVDAVTTTHPIDSRRIAIVGESYGGYVVLIAVARSDRFVAGVAENGVADLAAALAANPTFWRAELAGAADDRAELLARSPVAHAGAMAAPVLLVHAEDDAVSPIAQSEAMAAALAACGRETELARIPGEGHFVNVTGRPSRRIGKLRRVDAFLDHHLHGVLAAT
jgi:dipeptidyl aminopeptidase/acylaminoacyl peptidase